MRDWQIGEPVDDAHGAFADPMNWNRGSNDERDKRSVFPDNSVDGYSNKAWDLYMDFKDEEALRYIDMALDLDDGHARNWNRKAIILEGLKRYEESEESYNRSLELASKNVVCDNKARMLFSWAEELLGEYKKSQDNYSLLNDAKDIIIRAIRALPGDKSRHDVRKYLWLWDEINFELNYM